MKTNFKGRNADFCAVKITKKHILSGGLQQIQPHVLYSGRSHRMLLHSD